MGLLSFLNRNNVNNHKAIKSQSYHSTVAAAPPVRGSYPLTSNYSTDALQRAVREHNGIGVAVDGPGEWTPPPSFGRPRATSDVRSSTPQLEDTINSPPRPKSAGRHSRHLSGSGPPYLLTHPLYQSVRRDASDSVPPVPSVSDLTRKSVFVDILDAQSDLKPYNFRDRLAASGARDYGEDVAERNMVNGSVLAATPAAQASRLRTSLRSSSAPPRRNAPKPQLVLDHTPSYLSDDSDQGAPSPVVATGDESKKRIATAHGKMPKHGGKSGFSSPMVPTKTPSHLQLYHSTQGSQTSITEDERPSYLSNKSKASRSDKRMAARRMSASTLPSTTSKPKSKPRPLSLYPGISDVDNDDEAMPPSVPRYRDQAKPPNMPWSKSSKPVPVASPRTQRRASSVDPGMATLISRLTRESQLWDSGSESEDAHYSSQSMTAGRPVGQYASRSSSNILHYFTNKDVPSPELASLKPMERKRSRSRTKSLGGINLPKRPQLHEILEQIQARKSSLAAASSTATLATILSTEHSAHASFTRPHSQHTANTSVDCSGKSATASEASPSLNSPPPSSTYHTAMEEDASINEKQDNRRQSTRDAYGQKYPFLRLDSYEYPETSDSDADSFIDSPYRKQRDGEALLFRTTGYGNGGNNLPGLTHMLNGMEVEDADWEAQLSIPTNQDWYVGTRLQSRDATRRVQTPPVETESEMDSESIMSSINEAEFVSDVGEEQAQAIRHMRLSAMGGPFPRLVGGNADPRHAHYSNSRAQDMGKVGGDLRGVGATMKFRKEMKRQQRTRGQSRGSARMSM